MLEKLDDKTFKEKVEDVPGRVCVEFYADWCGWCKRQEQVSERIVERDSTGVPIYMMNGDEYPEHAQAAGLRGYPTYVLYENGEIVGTLVGAQPEQDVVAFLES